MLDKTLNTLSGRLEVSPLLDIVQIVAYSQQSGLLSIKGATSKGLVIFKNGDVVCAYSPGALTLLVKAAKEADADHRLTFRRIQVLTALKELLEIPEGEYRFVKREEPVDELQGLDIQSFYAAGALDTGDLLLVLEKAMDPDSEEVAVTTVEYDNKPKKAGEEARVEPRYGPFTIPAELFLSDLTVFGYLTNLSRGGTFFHTDELPDEGAVGRVRFELPWGLGQCRAKVKVAWQRSEGAEPKKGVGLSFLEFSPDSKRRIALCLERFAELAADVDFEA